MEMLQTTEFWVALAQIMGINIVLSGDNAVVIALASRNLPPNLQKKAIFWGGAGAIIMRIVLTIVAVEMLAMPYLKIAGAFLLLWVAVQLLLPEKEHDEGEKGGSSDFMVAFRTILIADLVMSLDNVLAVAAAAKGNLTLLIVGLALSIPLIIFGSAFLLKVMERFPIIITFGAALLGYVAGEMLVGDPAVAEWVNVNAGFLHYAAPIAGAVFVVLVGKALAKAKTAAAH